jgi:hypothetical protein
LSCFIIILLVLKYKKSLAGPRWIMALNKIDGGHFSAIAASSNPTLKRDCAKARSPLARPLWFSSNRTYSLH